MYHKQPTNVEKIQNKTGKKDLIYCAKYTPDHIQTGVNMIIECKY